MSLSASRPTQVGLQQSIAELKHCDFFSTARDLRSGPDMAAHEADLASCGGGDALRFPRWPRWQGRPCRVLHARLNCRPRAIGTSVSALCWHRVPYRRRERDDRIKTSGGGSDPFPASRKTIKRLRKSPSSKSNRTSSKRRYR